MLRELYITNFALIDSLTLQFSDRLTVLTGETGAGKSIIIDALNAVLGERVGAEIIREGAEEALIEAVFSLDDAPTARQPLEQAGLDDADQNSVILTRRIGPSRSRYWINHHPSTLSLLEEVGRHLVDIHGQHQHQTLLHEANHLRFLDAFGGRDHLQLSSQFGQLYERFRQAQTALAGLRSNERDRAQRVDMLRFQVEEIEQAGLQVEEEQQLAAERERLSHSEQLQQAVTAGLQALDGAETEPGAQQAVASAVEQLQQASHFDEELAPLTKRLEAAAINLQEGLHDLYAYQNSLEFSPERLDEIEVRLNEIRLLKRKYGDSVAEVISYGQQARAELEKLESADQREDELAEEVEQLRREVGQHAALLSGVRQSIANKLEQQVTEEVRKLGMAEAQFEVVFVQEPGPEGVPGPDEQCYQCSETGIDQVRFLLSANPGEPLQPLSQVASGGELSRLMLALKSVSTRGVEIPTLAFDEIDVGIGGITAHAVAERLVAASQAAQVLCITHLPQIARMADQQVFVEKQMQDGRTVVRARTLADSERIDDLARMLGAAQDEQVVHEHAEELLKDAPQQREKIRAGQP